MYVDKIKLTESSHSSSQKCPKSLSDLRDKVNGISYNIGASNSGRSLTSRRLSQITGADDLSSLFDK